MKPFPKSLVTFSFRRHGHRGLGGSTRRNYRPGMEALPTRDLPAASPVSPAGVVAINAAMPRATAELDSGVLRVTGTRANDILSITQNVTDPLHQQDSYITVTQTNPTTGRVVTLGQFQTLKVFWLDVDAGASDDTVDVSVDLVDRMQRDPVTQQIQYGVETDIDGGDGDDTIRFHAPSPGLNPTNNNSTIAVHGGRGNDAIVADGTFVDSLFAGGAGNDTITITGSVSSFYPYYAPRTLIDGGSGDDRITVIGWADSRSIRGGTGNDAISIQSPAPPSAGATKIK